MPDPGEQLPGPENRLFLVIVAERPVAEHFEESVMVGVPSYLFEVVVLAGDAQALLRVHYPRMRWFVDAEENILERHHAGVGKEQGGITGRNQGRARHDLMAACGEETQKAIADLFPSHRLCFLLRVPGVVCCAAQQTLDYVLRITAAQQQPERPSAGLRLF